MEWSGPVDREDIAFYQAKALAEPGEGDDLTVGRPQLTDHQPILAGRDGSGTFA
jgi:hypothetical protein